MKSSTRHHTLHLFFKIKCCVGPVETTLHKQTKLGNEAEKVLSQGAIGTIPDIDQPSGLP